MDQLRSTVGRGLGRGVTPPDPTVLHIIEEGRAASKSLEHVFLNVYGAPEWIPRNEFRQPMKPGGPVR